MIEIGLTPSGNGYKLYFIGQPDLHMTDWAGCNFRTMTVKGQPHRGFKTPEEAFDFLLETFPDYESALQYAYRNGDGTFLNNDRAKQMDGISIYWNHDEKKWNVPKRISERK